MESPECVYMQQWTKRAFIISHHNQNDYHLGGMNVVNRLQTLQKRKSRLASVFEDGHDIYRLYSEEKSHFLFYQKHIFSMLTKELLRPPGTSLVYKSIYL